MDAKQSTTHRDGGADRGPQAAALGDPAGTGAPQTGRKKPPPWQKPVLEDVSGKVMAQPYIRFT